MHVVEEIGEHILMHSSEPSAEKGIHWIIKSVHSSTEVSKEEVVIKVEIVHHLGIHVVSALRWSLIGIFSILTHFLYKIMF